jgi:hypothetical protein
VSSPLFTFASFSLELPLLDIASSSLKFDCCELLIEDDLSSDFSPDPPDDIIEVFFCIDLSIDTSFEDEGVFDLLVIFLHDCVSFFVDGDEFSSDMIFFRISLSYLITF